MEAQIFAVEAGLSRVNGLDTKVDKLNVRLTSIEVKVGGLDTRLRSIEIAIAVVSGKLDMLVDNMPGWWHAPASAAGVFVVLIAAIAATHYLQALD